MDNHNLDLAKQWVEDELSRLKVDRDEVTRKIGSSFGERPAPPWYVEEMSKRLAFTNGQIDAFAKCAGWLIRT